MPTNPRPYLDDRHLWSVAISDAGRIALKPNRADSIYFDIAWSNSMPTNGPDGEHGSTVLDIGYDDPIRATGHAKRDASGAWTVTHLSASQYPTGRDTTSAQDARAREIIGEMLTAWASTHADAIVQADDIDRNNAARSLEEKIVRHEEALEILRANLSACEEGEPFNVYPDLPTDRR